MAKNEMKWIRQGLDKRHAESSSVIIFETQDTFRYKQFLAYINAAKKSGEITQALSFDMHRGLNEITFEVAEGVTQPKLVPVQPPSADTPDGDFISSMIAGGSGNRITAPRQALPMAEQFLLGFNQSVLMMTNIAKNEAITLAVNCWATDPTMLYKSDATVFIFGHAADLLPSSTRDLCAVIDVPLSTEEERTQLVNEAVKEFPDLNLKFSPEIVTATAGLNLHTTESILCESISQYGDFNIEVIARQKMDAIRKSGLLNPVIVDHGLEAVGGMQSTKLHIQNSFIDPLTIKRELALQLDMELPRGLLFYGPPGTGKTWFVEALAFELKMPFFKMGNIGSRWYGESEQNITKVQKIAEEVAPCILFIDEIDRWGVRGSSSEHEVTRKLFAQLLEWLGDRKRKSIIIGTTNVPKQLDPAFIRVGRFSDIIPILYPDLSGRAAILDVHLDILRQVPHSLEDADLTLIAEKTPYFSGAEMEGLVQFAQREALREGSAKVTMTHFDTMIENFTVDVMARKKETEKYLKYAKELCTDKRFIESLGSEVAQEQSRFKKLGKKVTAGGTA
jgi:ATP-dependent 26S proteasome regulatory subunit